MLSRIRRMVLFVVVMMMAAPAAGQGIDLMPEPISNDDVTSWAHLLALDNAQQAAIDPMHQAYLASFRTLRDGPMAAFAERFRTLDQRAITDAESATGDVIDEVVGLHMAIAGLDSQFLGEIEPLLGTEQREHLHWVRLQRERQRVRQSLGLNHSYGFGPSVVDVRKELATLIDDDALLRSLDTTLAGYQQDLTIRMRALAAASIQHRIGSSVRFAQFQAAAGGDMREMDRESYQASVEALGQENETIRQQIAALNIGVLPLVRPHIDDVAYWSLTDRVRRRTIPNVARYVYSPWRTWQSVLGLSDVEPDTMASITEIIMQNMLVWDRHFADGSTRWERFRDKTDGAPEAEREPLREEYGEDMETIRTANAAAITQAIEAIKALLGESQLETMGPRFDRLELRVKMGANSFYAARLGDLEGEFAAISFAADGDGGSLDVPIMLDVSTEVGGEVVMLHSPAMESNEPVQIMVASDAGASFIVNDFASVAAMPRSGPAAPMLAITRGEFDLYRRLLEDDGSMEEVLSSLYDDYLAGYREMVLPLVRAARNSGMGWAFHLHKSDEADQVTATPEEADAAVRASDDSIFEQLGVLLAAHDDAHQLRRAQLLRQRIRQRGRAQHVDWFGSREADQDLIRLLYHEDIEDASRAAINDRLPLYEQQLTELCTTRHGLKRQQQQRQREIMESYMKGAAPAADLQQSMEETQQSLRTVEHALVRLNSDMFNHICATLPIECSSLIEHTYIADAFPRVHHSRRTDGVAIGDLLAKALGLDDLAAPTRDTIEALHGEFRERDRVIESAMVNHIRTSMLSVDDEEGDHQVFEAYHERMQAMSFDRRELHLSLMGRLRRALSDDQWTAIGAPVSDD